MISLSPSEVHTSLAALNINTGTHSAGTFSNEPSFNIQHDVPQIISHPPNLSFKDNCLSEPRVSRVVLTQFCVLPSNNKDPNYILV